MPDTIADAALRQRLAAGRPDDNDAALLRRARLVMGAQAAGKPLTSVADEAGIHVRSLQKWAGSVTYRILREHLVRGEVATVERKTDDVVAFERGKYLSDCLPLATNFVRECFERKPNAPPGIDGYVDRGAAQWASEKLLKGGGLSEPQRQTTQRTVLSAEAMKVLLDAIRADAAPRAADAAVDAEFTPTTEEPKA